MNRPGIAACGALGAIFGAIAVATHVPMLARVEAIVPLVALAHLAWLAATRARPQRASVLVMTVLLAVLCVSAQPVAEDDYWRFLWDGYRTLADGTPYGRAPAEWFGDASLPAAMQAVLDGVNHPEVPTIYGPLLQWLFVAAHWLAPADPLGLSVLFGVLHVACTALALRFIPAHRVALAAWNPLLLQQCLINLHPDFLLGWLLLAAAIAARRGAAAATGAVLALAVATKVSALVAAPLLWIAVARHQRAARSTLLRTAVFGLAVLLILYLPWLSTAATEGSGLAAFAEAWRFNPALFAPLALLVGDATARPIAAVLVGLIALALAARATPRRAFGSVVLALAVVLALSPVINAWYLAWLLPCATMTRWRAPWVAAAALPLSMLTMGELGLAGEPFAIPGPVLALQWAIIAAAVVFDVQGHCHRRHAHGRLAQTERSDAPSRSANRPNGARDDAPRTLIRCALRTVPNPQSPTPRDDP